MKKIEKYLLKLLFCMGCLLSLLMFVLCFTFDNGTHAFALESSRITYAKAKDNCFLFRTSDVTNSNYSNVFFMVPKTYFVTILSKINSFIFKVQYKNKIGYVASDSVTEVSFIPSTLSLDRVTFDTLDTIGTQIRSLPNAEDSSNVIMIVPAGSTGINYISYIYGSVPSGGNSDIWYYAEYEPISDPTSVYEGYIYSEKTKNLSVIENNKEGLTESDGDQNDKNTDDKFIEYSHLNSSVKTILIVLICIPVVVIFILLIVSNKKKKIVDEIENQTKRYETEKSEKISRPKSRSLDGLKGRVFKEKTSSTLISKEIKTDEVTPVFPTYEVIDDDDLL